MDKLGLALVLGAIIFVGMQVFSSGDGSFDYVPWADAMEEARSSGKPMMIYYGGDW